MIFNSIDFALFLPIVFLLYWFVTQHNLRSQNMLIVVASYVFYGWWDWRFLSLILFSSLVDFLAGKKLGATEEPRKRKMWLWLSITVNLGLLGFFKYYNFFLENFEAAFSFFGNPISGSSLEIILPVGISFYTFQTMSYTIDVYRKKLEPTHDFVAFSAFVSFFPQLVAGPIERATHLLPQFYVKRQFDYSKAVDGMRQILWGLFKKVVIADNCAEFANVLFENSQDYSGSTLALGGLLFTFQIYGDFSGYSDIAIGTSRLFGFDLMQNFKFPYFSRDIAEFWRRWHISLSTWFRDYVYIPLGGSRGGKWMSIRNTFIIFVVSGFWHGANWTFIVWGLLNAIYFLPLLLLHKNRTNLEIVAQGQRLPTLKEFISMGTTFMLVVIAWIIFRSENLGHAYHYLGSMLYGLSQFESYIETLNFVYWKIGFALPILLLLFLVIEWFGRENHFAIETLFLRLRRPLRLTLYLAIVFTLFWYGGNEQQFIYFQF